MVLGKKPPIRNLEEILLNKHFQQIVKQLQDNDLTEESLGENPKVFVESCYERTNDNQIE